MKNLNLLYFNQQFKEYCTASVKRAMLHNYIIASSTNKYLLPAMKPQICWKAPALCRMYKDLCLSHCWSVFLLCGGSVGVHLKHILHLTDFFNNAFSGRKGDQFFWIFFLCSKHLQHFSVDLLVFFSNSRLIKRGIKGIFKESRKKSPETSSCLQICFIFIFLSMPQNL